MLGILIGSRRCYFAPVLIGRINYFGIGFRQSFENCSKHLASIQSDIMKIGSGASGGINGEIHGRRSHKFGMESRYTKLNK